MEILTASKLTDALDLSKEDPKVLERYGKGDPKPHADGAPLNLQHFLLAQTAGTYHWGRGRRIAELKSPRSRSHVANNRAFDASDESSQQRCASRLANSNRRCRSKARHRRRSRWFSRIRETIKARSLPQRRHVSDGSWSASHVGHFMESKTASALISDSAPFALSAA